MTIPFVLRLMAAACSCTPSEALARDVATPIAQVVSDVRPLFAGPAGSERTAALVVAVAWRESKFDNRAVSETDDYCLVQIHARPSLARDVTQCLRTGIWMLRESFRSCAAWPIATYAEGPRGCSSKRAKWISDDRMGLAEEILRVAQAA